MSAELSTFAERLRYYREAAGLSQEDLAERAGLSSNAIGALERGVRSTASLTVREVSSYQIKSCQLRVRNPFRA